MPRWPAAVLLAATSVAAACDRRAPVRSCDDNLHGVWTTPSGARWMMLDNGGTLEAFPLFDDAVPDGAPRAIDLQRERGPSDSGASRLAGEIKRRYMRRADACEARAPLHVTACTNDALQVVAGEVAPPLGYAPCSWGAAIPSRVETWRRQ